MITLLKIYSQAVRVATQYAPAQPAAAHLQSIAYTPYACGALLYEYSVA